MLYLRAGKDEAVIGRELARTRLATPAQAVSLRLELAAPSMHASYSTDGKRWIGIGGKLDASLLSVDTAGGFIGNTFGPYAVVLPASGN